MNQGQFTALMEQLRRINSQLAQLLAKQAGADTLHGAGTARETPSHEKSPAAEAIPAEDLPTVRRKFKKAKGGG